MKKPLLTCGKLNKYFFLPFITPIICAAANSLILLIEYENNFVNYKIIFYIIYLSFFFLDLYILLNFQKKMKEKTKIILF